MTNPKTDHYASKSTAVPHQARRVAASTRENQTVASTSMIEACDRLGHKLDDLAGLVRAHIEAGKQPTGYHAEAAQQIEHVPSMKGGRKMQAGRRAAAQNPQPDGGAVTPQIEADQVAGAQAQSDSSSAGAGALTSDAKRAASASAVDAGRVADAISRAQNAGQEQAASIQQALEAVMSHLESQAASATLKVDVANIMNRLRDLEEQQQSMQSQFSSNRWGPS